MGGKQRIAARLVEHMRPFIERASAYVEPFVGSASVLCRVDHPRRIGADTNRALITMWRALAEGWEPPSSVSEEEYAALKAAKDPSNPLTAFAGFGCAFAGDWFAGYARSAKKGTPQSRGYAAEAKRGLAKKMATLGGVQWVHADYREVPIPLGACVYCDPPYAGTKPYKAAPPFESGPFWDWCHEIAETRGAHVFVSEYSAPHGVEEALAIPTRTGLKDNKGKTYARVERLFEIVAPGADRRGWALALAA